jgi:hypothetical protein
MESPSEDMGLCQSAAMLSEGELKVQNVPAAALQKGEALEYDGQPSVLKNQALGGARNHGHPRAASGARCRGALGSEG